MWILRWIWTSFIFGWTLELWAGIVCIIGEIFGSRTNQSQRSPRFLYLKRQMFTVPAQVLWHLPWSKSDDISVKKMPQISRPVSVVCSCLGNSTALPVNIFSRRDFLYYTLCIAGAFQAGVSEVALAESASGYRQYIDKFDGYTFMYPQSWIQVRGAGADVFFRDPVNLDENVSVEITSPSSSRFKSIEDLGPPAVAAEKVLKQYLTEFMSTRLGVRRESNILSANSRVADDGRLYYEIEANVKSFANSNQMAIMPEDRPVQMEWDRRYLSVLGVENNCLYELRLQSPEKVFAQEQNDLRQVMNSFRVVKIEN